MPGENAFRVEGVIVDVLQPALFRVELPNGHRLLAHVSRRERVNLPVLSPGDTVTLDISPYDLSKGRIYCANRDGES